MWWTELTTFQQILFIVGCSATGFMALQIVFMLIFGLDDGADGDFSSDGDLDFDGCDGHSVILPIGLKLLSLRSALAFLSIGSWAAFAASELHPAYTVVIGVFSGIAAALILAIFMTFVEKAQSSGNINIANAVGKTAEVYLRIPKNRQGSGKVNVIVQERLTEFNAVTDGEEIPTGTAVKIISTVNENILLVEKL